MSNKVKSLILYSRYYPILHDIVQVWKLSNDENRPTLVGNTFSVILRDQKKQRKPEKENRLYE